MRTHHTIFLLCLILVIISSCCKDKDKTCGAGTFTDTLFDNHLSSDQFQVSTSTFNENTVYYNYDTPGKVKFSVGRTVSNICPYTQVRILFDATTTGNEQSKMIVVKGGAVWSGLAAGYHHDVLLTSFPILASHVYEDEFNIDLNEAFGDEVGDMDVLLTIEFDTLSTFQEDSTYFIDHIGSLRIQSEGDKFQ